MSILVRYHPQNLTAEQYDAVVRREQASPTYPPDGREYHVCFGTDGDLNVSEIWVSPRFLGFQPKRVAEFANGNPVAWYKQFLEDTVLPHAGLFAHLQAYGEILMPMLSDAGIQFSAEPEIIEVHRADSR